jgi:dihydroorotate dehydrogenase (NAD+) catalytic subunit
VEAAGADALSLINTIVGMSVDVYTRRPRLAFATGGLSGPAVKPIAVRMVYEVSQAVQIPRIGIGGVATAMDALEFIIAGATAVQVGTANYADPCASVKVADGLGAYCRERGVRVRELIGTLAVG